RFPERKVCKDCEDYEDIVIKVQQGTVGQVKAAIATQLGIEADEFVIYYKFDDTKYESESDVLFAKIYLPSDYAPYLKDNGDGEPFDINAYESWGYKGKTGMLKWILSQPGEAYCDESDLEGSQLAKRLAKHIAAFKAQHNTSSTSSASSVENSIGQE
ncbi:hypothetical protein GGI16_001341, partial [Coemansia sp. S142-1]